MKKQITLLSAAAGLLLANGAIAQDAMLGDSLYDDSSYIPTVSLTAYAGLWKYVGSDKIETSKEMTYGAQFQLRVFDPHLSLVGRFSTKKADIEPQGYCGQWISGDELEESYASGELRVDLCPDSPVNLYASGGIYWTKYDSVFTYTRTEIEYGFFFPRRYNRTVHERDEDDGIAPIGHIGIEIKPGPFYLGVEVGAIGKVKYDDDEGEKIKLDVRGTAGIQLSPGVRTDVLLQYVNDNEDDVPDEILSFAAGLTVEI